MLDLLFRMSRTRASFTMEIKGQQWSIMHSYGAMQDTLPIGFVIVGAPSLILVTLRNVSQHLQTYLPHLVKFLLHMFQSELAFSNGAMPPTCTIVLVFGSEMMNLRNTGRRSAVSRPPRVHSMQ